MAQPSASFLLKAALSPGKLRDMPMCMCLGCACFL